VKDYSKGYNGFCLLRFQEILCYLVLFLTSLRISIDSFLNLFNFKSKAL
jgi:hypothetical protein